MPTIFYFIIVCGLLGLIAGFMNIHRGKRLWVYLAGIIILTILISRELWTGGDTPILWDDLSFTVYAALCIMAYFSNVLLAQVILYIRGR